MVKIKNNVPYRKFEDEGTIKKSSVIRRAFRFATKPLRFVNGQLRLVKSKFRKGVKDEYLNAKNPPIVLDTGKKLGAGGSGEVLEVDYKGQKAAHKKVWMSREEAEIKYGLSGDERAIMEKLDHPHILKTVQTGVSYQESGVDPDLNSTDLENAEYINLQGVKSSTDEVVLVRETGVDSALDSTDLESAEYVNVESVETSKDGLLMPLREATLTSVIKKLPGNRQTHCLNLLSAIRHMHEKGYSHMDIKPDNILWSEEHGLQICDFDAVIPVDESGKFPSTQQAIMFTHRYAPPEILDFFYKLRSVNSLNGVACDSWSLGCTIAEILTTEPVFSTKDVRKNPDNPQSVKKSSEIEHEKKVEAYLKKHEHILGTETCDVLRGMLEVNPEKRLTVKEAIEKLQTTFGWVWDD